ncbi:MAG: ribosome-binding ATPase [Thermoleophilaceae bacterium]|jgi:GTP-binding protein YchF|nr:ribosome-binding ATPase [Thermoleophilaceae bacterium]
MKVGIVGLPNAGKSSLFNALTRAGAEAGNYPFTTVEPNVAIVPVPDDRLDRIAETIDARPLVYETIAFHDIAGLVRGAHSGEGLGNKFLANIRETDAILHVVRAHEDAQVVHPEGRVDPAADAETIETELLYADLEQAERRLERVSKQAKSLDRAAMAEEGWLRELVAGLQEGRPAREFPPPPDAPDALRNLQPLTAKPVLYVANVGEDVALEPPPELAARGKALAVSARIESELAELDDEEAAVMRADLGVTESGLDRIIKGAFELLELISFFTAGEGKEARAHAIPAGTTAWQAAGKIHSDIQRGFVRAEVVPWDVLVDAGGYAGARDRGALRLEGRDYPMADGDVITIKFTP